MKTALYCRTSSDPRDERMGVARQEADCRALCERLGWQVVGLYVDNDASAFSGKPREQYERMMHAVSAGNVDAIVAATPDRLYRRLADLARFIDVVREAGCIVQTVAGGEVDLSTASGRQTAGFLGVAAAGESDRQSERIRRRLAANAASGKPHGGLRPYGYESDRRTVRESEAVVVREAAERVLAGESLRGVARDLNERGLHSATGQRWLPPTLRGVLLRPRNAAIRLHRGQEVGPGDWPPLLDEPTWRALVRALTDEGRITTPGRAGRLHLLSGLGTCTVCDRPIYSWSRGRGGAMAYRCRSGHGARDMDYVDALITGIVLRWLSRPAAMDLLHPPDDDRARHAARQATQLRHRLDEAAQAFADGQIDTTQLSVVSNRLRPQLAQAERQAAPQTDRGRVLAGLAGRTDVRARWDALTIDRRRAVIAALLDFRIGPASRGCGRTPDNITITWRT